MTYMDDDVDSITLGDELDEETIDEDTTEEEMF
ncbi:MAG: hypothetical protein RLZZ26_179 [Candidatus Parcubacteria bacterium]|jgi:hypothetical protein